MCIKNLPPLLCIQLKRFGYDWEANRALKFDDYFKVSICFKRFLLVQAFGLNIFCYFALAADSHIQ